MCIVWKQKVSLPGFRFIAWSLWPPSGRPTLLAPFTNPFSLPATPTIVRRRRTAIGISVDHRRKNRSVEAYQTNVRRLKDYKSRLILFPRNANKPKAGDAAVAERKLASQLKGTILPLKSETRQPKIRVPTEDEKKFGAHFTIRKARITKRLHGKRVKKDQEGKDQFNMF